MEEGVDVFPLQHCQFMHHSLVFQDLKGDSEEASSGFIIPLSEKKIKDFYIYLTTRNYRTTIAIIIGI